MEMSDWSSDVCSSDLEYHRKFIFRSLENVIDRILGAIDDLNVLHGWGSSGICVGPVSDPISLPRAVNDSLPARISGGRMTQNGRYRPQEPSIASSPEDTRLAICQFEFGMRNRINAVERLASASKHFVFAQASDESRSVGVTPIRHFELPRKLPRKCPAAPDPRRSLATTVCRPIRARHPYFF